MKKSYYFSHDYNCRDDEKIQDLVYTRGWAGYGVYWAIVELLYSNDGYMSINYDRIAYKLITDSELIESIVNDFDLFKINNDKFYSTAILDRLKQSKTLSKKNSDNAKKRWNDAKKPEEIKKPVKVNDIEKRKAKFINELAEFKDKYSSDVLNKFFLHWSEPNKSNTKMLFETKPTWKLSSRLARWDSGTFGKKQSFTSVAKEVANNLSGNKLNFEVNE